MQSVGLSEHLSVRKARFRSYWMSYFVATGVNGPTFPLQDNHHEQSLNGLRGRFGAIDEEPGGSEADDIPEEGFIAQVTTHR